MRAVMTGIRTGRREASPSGMIPIVLVPPVQAGQPLLRLVDPPEWPDVADVLYEHLHHAEHSEPDVRIDDDRRRAQLGSLREVAKDGDDRTDVARRERR